MTNTETTTRAAQATETDTIFANPYNTGCKGFYFTTLEEFTAGMLRLWAQGAEEVELDYCDGPHCELFSAAAIGQHNIAEWYDMLDTVTDDMMPALFYLLDDTGETLSDALQHLDDVSVTEGTALDYAHDYIEDSGMLSTLAGNLRYYFDHEAFARDMVLNGDICEFTYDGDTFTAQGV